MLKKNLILCLLLFFYSIVLAHNAIPHGHFEELFSSEHDSDSHDHNERSNHDHHFLFSHCISLHVAIEKQVTFSAHQSKISSKSTLNVDAFCLLSGKHFFTPPDSFRTLVQVNSESPIQSLNCTRYNRGPPESL